MIVLNWRCIDPRFENGADNYQAGIALADLMMLHAPLDCLGLNVEFLFMTAMSFPMVFAHLC